MLHESVSLQHAAEKYVSAENPLLFMHIPKTGGISLFTAFASLWGTDIADLYNITGRNPDSAGLLVADHSKILYCGHFAYGMHGWFDRPVYYASVLREPVARIVSLYYFCLPMLNHISKLLRQADWDLGRVSAPDYYLDFEPYLRHEQSPEAFFDSPSAELDNGMVRRFSGFGLNPAPCPVSALAQAKENIERHFSVVGLLERYAETLHLMSETFRLPQLAKNSMNINPQGKEKFAPLSLKIINKIRAMNELDIELYDWVCKRFDAHLQELRPPVAIPGYSRNDLASMPLWRAVGQSPLRQAVMEQRGVPVMKKDVPVRSLVCNRLESCAYNRKAISTTFDTEMVGPDNGANVCSRTQLVFSPQTAKQLALTLTKAVAEYEKEHGAI